MAFSEVCNEPITPAINQLCASLTSFSISPIPAQHRTSAVISQHCTLKSASCALHSLPLSSKDPEHFYLAVRSTMACSVGSSADHAPGFSLPQWDLVDSPAQNSWVLWTGPLHLPQGLSPFTIFLQLWKGTHTPRGMERALSSQPRPGWSRLSAITSTTSFYSFSPPGLYNTCLQ